MKVWTLASLAAAVFMLNAVLGTISYATYIYHYSVCSSTSTCIDCIPGVEYSHPSCTTAPGGVMCRLFKASTWQTGLTACVKTSTFSDQCHYTMSTVQTCTGMKYWECGCATQAAGAPLPKCAMLKPDLTPCICDAATGQGPLTVTIPSVCTDV
jgi:hypothetical protein